MPFKFSMTKDQKKLAVCMAVTFVVSFLLNHYNHFVGDAFNYHFSFATGERLTGLGSVIESMKAHYRTWSGRTYPHFFLQLILANAHGEEIYNVLNAIVYTVFGALLYFHGNLNGKFNGVLYWCVHFILWLLIPWYGMMFFTEACSVNYVWGTTLMLAVLLVYRYDQMGIRGFSGVGQTVGITVLSALAGGFSENSSAACILVQGLFVLYMLYRKRKVPVWSITAMLSGLVSWLILILAPGNQARLSLYQDDTPFLEKYAGRLAACIDATKTHCSWLVIAFIILFVLCWYDKKQKELLVSACLVFLGGLASNYALIGTPYIETRAMFGPIVFMFAACLMLAGALFQTQWKPALMAAGGIITFYFCIWFTFGVMDIVNIHVLFMQRQNYIYEQKAMGNLDITTYAIQSRTKYTGCADTSDLIPDSTNWTNAGMASYYGVNSISVDDYKGN